jgi:hypothetical protein
MPTTYDYTPVKVDDAFTLSAGAAILPSQLVSVTGVGAVSPSAGADRPIGVAAHAAASGAPVTIWPLPGYTHETAVLNAAVIAAGGTVISGAAGTINTGGSLATAGAAGTLLGIALTAGTGNAGGTVLVRWIGL